MKQDLGAIEPARMTSAGPPGWFAHVDRGALHTLCLATIAILLVVSALDHASAIAVPAILAVLASLALAPLVRRIERIGAPPSLAAALIVIGTLAATGGSIYGLAPSAETLGSRAPRILHQIDGRVREIAGGLARILSGERIGDTDKKPPVGTPLAPAAGDDVIDKLVEDGKRVMAGWAVGVPGIVGGGIFWAMLTFFFLRDRQMLARRMLICVAGSSARRALGRAIRDVKTRVARYLLAITVINIGLGLSVALGFWMLGVPNAGLWGAAAGLANFAPFIGAAFMTLVTLGLGLVSSDTSLVAFAPLAVLLGLNFVEEQIVAPAALGARMQIPPLTVFASVAFGAWLWGPAGALVATPTLIVGTAFITRLDAARRPDAQIRTRRR